MDIREFRAVISSAFIDQGFTERRLTRHAPKYWTLPGGDIVPFFAPHALRRPWGFALHGTIGIEIPALRKWLIQNKPGEQSGIFQTMFVGYHTANENVLRFMLDEGAPVPADLWIGLIKDRLLLIPSSVEALLTVYNTRRDELGWLAHPHQKAAWDFLRLWWDSPAPDLHVPQMLSNDPIV